METDYLYFAEFDTGDAGEVARGFSAFDEGQDITRDSVEVIRGEYMVGVVMEAPGKADLSERTMIWRRKSIPGV